MKNKTIKKVLNRLKKYRFAIVVSILLAAVTAAAALYVSSAKTTLISEASHRCLSVSASLWVQPGFCNG